MKMRQFLLLLLFCSLCYGQTLLTLSVMDPRDCKPVGGPGCEQAVPVICDATNKGPDTVLLTKAQCRTLMAAEGIVATGEPLATAIWRQRAKDELWGKLGRYARFLPIRVGLVGLLTWKVGVRAGFTAESLYNFADVAAESADARAPEIERNLGDLDADNVAIAVNGTGTVVAWASSAQVETLAYEQRTRSQWLVAGVPKSLADKLPTNLSVPQASLEPTDHRIVKQDAIYRINNWMDQLNIEIMGEPLDKPLPTTPCAAREYFCGWAFAELHHGMLSRPAYDRGDVNWLLEEIREHRAKFMNAAERER